MQRIKQKCFQHVFFSRQIPAFRKVSALYIPRDKASENYVTLQPFMDFQNVFKNIDHLERSIEKRKLSTNLKTLMEMFNAYQNGIKAIENIENEREVIAKQLKELSKQQTESEQDLITKLKDRGKSLRNDMKTLKSKFIPIEDGFIQAFLDLPNTLHNYCPEGDYEKLLYQMGNQEIETTKSHLDYDNYMHFIDDSRYYMLDEAAEFDIKCPQAFVSYFLEKGNFIQTANPDFTRSVLLEANATPMNRYHKVVESNLQNIYNPAFLTGGGSFESFLGAVAKLCIYPNVLPIKFVSIGRLYEIVQGNNQHNLFTATQNNAVQTFVATADTVSADEQMENILNLCVDFYKIFNIKFRVIYVNAAKLMPAESLRAQIEIFSPHEKRYIVVGSVSNYTDFVSKRVLFTMRQQKDYHFLHLIGGPVLYTSRFIAVLLEYGEKLDYEKILSSLNLNSPSDKVPSSDALNEFKTLFK